MTPAVGVEYTNSGHQKHGRQPKLWIHSEANVRANCCTQIEYLSTQLTMLKRFCCSFLRPPLVERINIKHTNVFCSNYENLIIDSSKK